MVIHFYSFIHFSWSVMAWEKKYRTTDPIICLWPLWAKSNLTMNMLLLLARHHTTDFSWCMSMLEYVCILKSVRMFTSVNVSDLALIGRVMISSPTPSTSTTSASLYLPTVLEHNVTCIYHIHIYSKREDAKHTVSITHINASQDNLISSPLKEASLKTSSV